MASKSFQTLLLLSALFAVCTSQFQSWHRTSMVMIPQLPMSQSSHSIDMHTQMGDQNWMHSSSGDSNFRNDRIIYHEESTRIKAVQTVDDFGRLDAAMVPVKSGRVSYVSPEGTRVKQDYVADENGYQAETSYSNIVNPSIAGMSQTIFGNLRARPNPNNAGIPLTPLGPLRSGPTIGQKLLSQFNHGQSHGSLPDPPHGVQITHHGSSGKVPYYNAPAQGYGPSQVYSHETTPPIYHASPPSYYASPAHNLPSSRMLEFPAQGRYVKRSTNSVEFARQPVVSDRTSGQVPPEGHYFLCPQQLDRDEA